MVPIPRESCCGAVFPENVCPELPSTTAQVSICLLAGTSHPRAFIRPSGSTLSGRFWDAHCGRLDSRDPPAANHPALRAAR